MRAIHIVDEIVVNIIEVESLDVFHPEKGYLHADNLNAEIGGTYKNNQFYPYRLSNKEQSELRRKAYEAEADPIYFLIQRNQATLDEWQAKISQIKDRYPYYYDDANERIEVQ